MTVEIRARGNLKGFTLIAGFPGIGVVGPIVAKHIVESQKMELIGHIVSDGFPAVSSIINGVAEGPVRIYADPKKKIAVIVSEIMFKEDSAKELGRELVRFAKKSGIKQIISIAGVLLPGNSESEVFGVVSEQKHLKILENQGVMPIPKGVTTGISATLLVNGRQEGVPVILLLGTLHAKEDYRAAADIVRKLDEMLKLNIDYESLLDRAREIERDVTSVMQHSKAANSMYG